METTQMQSVFWRTFTTLMCEFHSAETCTLAPLQVSSCKHGDLKAARILQADRRRHGNGVCSLSAVELLPTPEKDERQLW